MKLMRRIAHNNNKQCISQKSCKMSKQQSAVILW